jgi:hypothetical protein
LLGVFVVSGVVLVRTWREYRTIFLLETSQVLELEPQCSKNEKYMAHIIQMLNDEEFVEHMAGQKRRIHKK